MNIERHQKNAILKDLETGKIVFLVGPRQVGKTYLSKEIAGLFTKTTYLNYDSAEHRDVIKKEAWLPDTELLILDELHKMRGWKNYLKGVYDTKSAGMRMLVTGSARLDAYRTVGDSLAGRFFVHRLLPFSVKELEGSAYATQLERLIDRGGFPEPFLAATDADAVRWRRSYADSLLRQDVLDFKDVNNWRALREVFELLQHKVGSPVSYSNIAADVGVSPATVKSYITTLEALFMVFVVRPYSKKVSGAIRKEPKIYFYDTGLVQGDTGVRFENAVAVSLLKHVRATEDTTGARTQLAYVRQKSGHEVDFAIVRDNVLELLVEAKESESEVSKSLAYFTSTQKVSGVQVVHHIKTERTEGDFVTVRRAEEFLKTLAA